MIDHQWRPFGVSLVEAVLARWLVERSGREYEIDRLALHAERETPRGIDPDPTQAPAADAHPAPPADAAAAGLESSSVDAPEADAPAAGPESSPADSDPVDAVDAAADGLEVDDRFPALHRFGRLLELGAGHLEVARAAYQVQSRHAAVQARALAAFAAARPAELLDRPDHEVGAAAAASRAARPAALTEVSEWAVDEVMATFALSSQAAGSLLADSITLAERLPATLDALEAGQISWAHARMLVEVLGPVKDEVRTAVEDRLLAGAAGKTVAQLRQAARRAVLHADADAATKRLARAIRDRGVRMHAGKDGMASLEATMPLPVAAACRKALAAYAAECVTPGDQRTLDQRMADCLVDLIMRPGVNGPVQIGLTLVAGVDTMAGGDAPAELDGHPIPAALARELAYVLGLLSRPETPDDPADGADEADDSDNAEVAASEDAVGRNQDSESARAAHADAAGENETSKDAANQGAANQGEANQGEANQGEANQGEANQGEEPASASAGAFAAFRPALDRRQEVAEPLGELLRLRSAGGTALAHLPRIAIVEEITGQLLALTDAAGIRRAATCDRARCRTGTRPCTHSAAGPGLGPPPRTRGYSPSDPLARFVRARDRRCRFPGCRAIAIRCDLDHNRPWPDGPTSADNLCCLCRHHHRLSHQAPGWTMTRLPDGGLRWTTPGGQTLTTYPPGYGTDDDLPPPAPTRPAEPAISERGRLSTLEQIRSWPPPPPDPDEEPAPF